MDKMVHFETTGAQTTYLNYVLILPQNPSFLQLDKSKQSPIVVNC